MEFSDKVKGYLSNSTPVITKFLDVSEQAILHNHLKNKIPFAFFGGYPDAEKKRASIYQKDFDITCFKIIYNANFLTLSHQNILGSLLSLSIRRDSIGDILPRQQVFFATNEIRDFLLLEFTKIGNHSIQLVEVAGSSIISETALLESVFTVDSLRLDAVVAHIIRKSRNESTLLIKSDLVKVNHLIETKTVKTIKENDIISIRKHGRFRILDTKATSRKGKIIVKYGKYA